ncbi:hypothetical protein JFN87_19420 [Streptomyces bomunensis]|uniref:Uncharacterized protein n=1 Tax=Streptomyces montanisoli TaxID=2798581 RepID=A0A940RWN4_9ACTN|nr:hypothetical protein [Streptomyces montanisoli]
MSRATSAREPTGVGAAARNNAEWCAAVCRAHGVPYRFSGTVWWSPRRTPPYYPEAVTLRPGVRPGELLRLLDTGTPGCSVKDSFAALDLSGHGFAPLLHGQWLRRPAGVAQEEPAGISGEFAAVAVRGADRLGRWVSAWHGGEDGEPPPDIFRPALLRDPAVRVLAVHRTHADGRLADGSLADGELVGGAVLNLGAGLVGVSNVFAVGAVPLAAVWTAVVRAAAVHFPECDLVGYEDDDGDDDRDDDPACAHVTPADRRRTPLGAALDAGFRVLGPLRVWVHHS